MADFPQKLLGPSDALQLSQTLAQSSGLAAPLSPALRALAEELGRGRLSRALETLAQRLDAGVPLEKAIEEIRLPAHIQALITLGIQSNDLPGALEQLILQQRIASELRRRLRLIVAYPMLLLAILVAWLTFCAVYLIPEFEQVIKEFDVEISPSLQLQYELAAALVRYGLGALTGTVSIMAVLWFFGGRWIIDWVRRGIPLFGPLWQYHSTAELCQMLALLLQRAAPLPSALDWSAAGIGDQVLARSTRALAQSIRSGGDLTRGLASDDNFPETLVPIVAWGERTTALDEAFGAAADLFADRVELQIGLIRFLVPPFVFLGVAVMISLVVSSTVAPLVSLITMLSL